MVSAAGRGRPRPLLAGVFRKACDYCVRSKRGCNGGTPCEQCIRREQTCTYSQRRKSGPRGRPVRQQPASPSSASSTRSSTSGPKSGTTQRVRRSSTCSIRDNASTSSNSSTTTESSPGRTDSVSSYSCESSQSEAWDSDTEMPSTQVEKSEPTSPRQAAEVPAVASKVKPRLVSSSLYGTTSSDPEAAPKPISESSVVQPMLVTGSNADRDVKDAVWPLPSVDAGQPLQRPEGHMVWAPPSLPPSRNDVIEEPTGTPVLHEITSQPWEISSVCTPSPIVGEGVPVFPNVRGFGGVTSNVMQTNPITTTTVHLAAHGSASPFAAALLQQGSFSEDVRDFGLELCECPSLGGMKPSLTREVSLARAVEALGGEHSTQSMGVHDIPGFVL